MVNPDQIKSYAQALGKGFLLDRAPGIAAGIINELFREWNVDVARIKADIHNDRDLWDNLTPAQWGHFNKARDMIGDMDFLTADLVIKAIAKDYPGIASLFLNSPSAYQWLEKQMASLKERLESC
ncbi:MAG: hypothetical protein R6V51_02820 [Dehalococcoidia bacterium]